MSAAAPARLLASPAIRTLISRRLGEIGGIVLGLGGVALLVALACYNPLDPSINTATSRPPTNLAGAAGAMAADLLIQGFGVAAVLPGLVALAWAWRIASHRGLGSFAARLASTVAALPVVAALASVAPLPQAWPAEAGPGGAIGRVLAQTTASFAQGVLGPLGAAIALAAGFALGRSPRATGWGAAPLGCCLGCWRRSAGPGGSQPICRRSKPCSGRYRAWSHANPRAPRPSRRKRLRTISPCGNWPPPPSSQRPGRGSA